MTAQVKDPELFSPDLSDFSPPTSPTDASMSSFPGVYALFSKDEDCLYIGQSISVKARLRQHRKKTWWNKVDSVRTLRIQDEESRLIREAVLILAIVPQFNRAVKLAKRTDGTFYEVAWLR